MAIPSLLVAPVDITSNFTVPTIGAGSNRTAGIVVSMYNGAGTAKLPTTVTCNGKTAVWVAGDLVATSQTRVATGLYLILETDVAAISGQVIATTGQAGTVKNMVFFCLKDVKQGAPTASASQYLTAAGTASYSLPRLANSFTMTLAHCSAGSATAMTNPAKVNTLTYTSGGGLNIAYGADTAQTVASTVTVSSGYTSALSVNFESVPVYVIDTINGASINPTINVGGNNATVTAGGSGIVASLSIAANGFTSSAIEAITGGAGNFTFAWPWANGTVQAPIGPVTATYVDSVGNVSTKPAISALPATYSAVTWSGAIDKSAKHLGHLLTLPDGDVMYYPNNLGVKFTADGFITADTLPVSIPVLLHNLHSGGDGTITTKTINLAANDQSSISSVSLSTIFAQTTPAAVNAVTTTPFTVTANVKEIFVHIFTDSGTSGVSSTPTTVTYAGIPMNIMLNGPFDITQKGMQQFIYRLKNPPLGTANIVIRHEFLQTYSVALALTATGPYTTTFGTPQVATSNALSSSVYCDVGGLVVQSVLIDGINTAAPTPTTGQTAIATGGVTGNSSGATAWYRVDSKIADTTRSIDKWTTTTAQRWTAMAYSINPVTSTGLDIDFTPYIMPCSSAPFLDTRRFNGVRYDEAAKYVESTVRPTSNKKAEIIGTWAEDAHMRIRTNGFFNFGDTGPQLIMYLDASKLPLGQLEDFSAVPKGAGVTLAYQATDKFQIVTLAGMPGNKAIVNGGLGTALNTTDTPRLTATHPAHNRNWEHRSKYWPAANRDAAIEYLLGNTGPVLAGNTRTWQQKGIWMMAGGNYGGTDTNIFFGAERGWDFTSSTFGGPAAVISNSLYALYGYTEKNSNLSRNQVLAEPMAYTYFIDQYAANDRETGFVHGAVWNVTQGVYADRKFHGCPITIPNGAKRLIDGFTYPGFMRGYNVDLGFNWYDGCIYKTNGRGAACAVLLCNNKDYTLATKRTYLLIEEWTPFDIAFQARSGWFDLNNLTGNYVAVVDEDEKQILSIEL